MVQIMAEQAACRLSLNRMLLLGAAAALAVPVTLGVVHAKSSQIDNAVAEGKD